MSFRSKASGSEHGAMADSHPHEQRLWAALQQEPPAEAVPTMRLFAHYRGREEGRVGSPLVVLEFELCLGGG